MGTRAGVHLTESKETAPATKGDQNHVGSPLVPKLEEDSTPINSDTDQPMNDSSLDIDSLDSDASDSDATIDQALDNVDWDPNLLSRNDGEPGILSINQ